MIAGLISDINHAVRLYLNTIWQSLAAVIMLAVAMALVTAMASLWSDLHLGGTPGLEDNRGLVTISVHGGSRAGALSSQVISDLASASHTLERISGAATFGGLHEVELDGQILEGVAEPVLPNYFETLRPRLVFGRGLKPEDFEGDNARVLVISHQFWENAFERDPDIIGREVEMAGQRWRVVGVSDPDFQGLGAAQPLFWVPYRRYFSDLQRGMPVQLIDRLPIWRIAARIAAGISIEAAESELRQFVSDYDFPSLTQKPSPERIFLIGGLVENPEAHEAAQRQVSQLLIAALFISIVTAVNTGVFLLARAPRRRRELALRQMLGASRRRLVRQLLCEAAVLVFPAAVAGAVLSIWFAALIRTLPFFEGAGFSGQVLSWPVLGFSVLLVAVFTAIVALAPVSFLRRGRLSQDSRLTISRPTAFQHGAAFVQLGLCGLMAPVAIAFLLHLMIMHARESGFEPADLLFVSLAIEIRPGQQIIPPDEDEAYAFRASVRERLHAVPGVQQVSFGAPAPGQRMYDRRHFDFDGQSLEVRMVNAGPGLLELLGIELLRGREFESDNEPGVIVSRQFAEQAWGNLDVLDRFLTVSNGEEADEAWRVIGVANDVRFDHPNDPMEPMAFISHSGMGAFMANVIVRGQMDPEQIGNVVEETLAGHLDLVRVNQVHRVSALLKAQTVPDRMRAAVAGLFGLALLLMAGFGLFAMQRFMTESSKREAAICMAVGAGPKRIRRHVFMRGIRFGLPGLLAGTLLAVIIVGLMTEDLLSAQVSPLVVAGLGSFSLLALIVLATTQPAIGASRLRPGAILKEE